jgi:predicted MPP superfamily phosphohydrolase
MSEITILHLSEIHFKKKKDDHNKTFRQEVQEKLIEAVAAHSKEHGAPDFVAITGDISFSGKKTVYDEALDFFKKLKAIFLKKNVSFLGLSSCWASEVDNDQSNMDEDNRPYLNDQWWEETLLLYTGLMNLEMKKRSNAVEWCRDWYNGHYYKEGTMKNP